MSKCRSIISTPLALLASMTLAMILAMALTLILAMPAQAKRGPSTAQLNPVQASSQASSVHISSGQKKFKRANFHKAKKAKAKPSLWAQNKISAKDAKSIARKKVPGGEVVDIERDGDIYRVRIIKKNGHVVDVSVDANTGRVTR